MSPLFVEQEACTASEPARPTKKSYSASGSTRLPLLPVSTNEVVPADDGVVALEVALPDHGILPVEVFLPDHRVLALKVAATNDGVLALKVALANDRILSVEVTSRSGWA